MVPDVGLYNENGAFDRRRLLKWAGVAAAAANVGAGAAQKGVVEFYGSEVLPRLRQNG